MENNPWMLTKRLQESSSSMELSKLCINCSIVPGINSNSAVASSSERLSDIMSSSERLSDIMSSSERLSDIMSDSESEYG
ncbi:hypothetical protein TNCT_216471 [Trichonephila clavata]|uniref:Uncharacterized protein n=1 Tax=Trichonephila clavata TaxID=2740835 RepID=A0A8X6FZI7_TRICU|nr:hypothetical protein TNCT_216471 [Trichonephila clavata]